MKISNFTSLKRLAASLCLAGAGSLQAQTGYITLHDPGSTFSTSCAGDSLTLTATAYITCSQSGTNANCPVDYVNFFYADGNLIGTDYTAGPGFQYSVPWTSPPLGPQSIYAIAVSGANFWQSNTRTVTIQAAEPNITSVSSGSFSFNIPGSSATWGVYKSTDLVNWTSAGNTTLSGGTATFTDNTISGVSYRFYKITNNACCSGPIGFARITAGPGWTAIANQFDVSSDHNPAQNTLPAIFAWSVLPSGTVLLKENTLYTWNGSSWSGSTTLSPGEGAFIQNNTTNAFTITFAGHVRTGVLTLPLVTAGQRVSSILPQAGGLTSTLGYDPLDGDYVLKWSYQGQGWISYMYFDEFGWWDGSEEPVEPGFNVGESFYLDPAGSNYWTRTFFPCQ